MQTTYPLVGRGKLTVVPNYRTVVATYESGYEQRVRRWLSPLFEFQIDYDDIMTETEWDTLHNFFHQHAGQQSTFYFQDWTRPDRKGELIGVGDGLRTRFKIYEDWASSVVVYKNGVLQVQPSQVSVNLTTGYVDFVVPPESGAIITADVYQGLFRVRFAEDGLRAGRILGAGWVVTVRLRQVRPE